MTSSIFNPNRVLSNASPVINSFKKTEPKPRRKYSGSILFTHGAYGDIAIIQSDFGKMPDSPCFYEHQQKFITDAVTKNSDLRRDLGAVHLFQGYYRKFKNGNGRFVGEVEKLM